MIRNAIPVREMNRHSVPSACLAGLLVLSTFATPTFAGVLTQLADIPRVDARQRFLGDIDTTGSGPIEAMDTHTETGLTQFAHGRVSYSGIGLRASQSANFHAHQFFEVSALLRYDDLEFSSSDGATSVTGNLNLSLDGTHALFSTNPGSTQIGVAVDVFARTNSSSTGGTYSHGINFLGDNETTSGLLTGYSGNGPFGFSAPLTFSTTSPEKIEIELQLFISANPNGFNSVSAEGNFLDTLNLNPAELVTFTSGLNPTFSSTTGEIINNQLVVPEPSAFLLALLGIAVTGLALRLRAGVTL